MRQIYLVNTDKVALVDDEDFALVSRHTWYLFTYERTDYAKAIVDGAWIGMHTLVMPTPSKEITVDHIDHTGLNNQKYNLRHATLQQQRQHMQKRKGRVTSKYKGVSYSKERDKWVAQICIDGKQTNIGRFNSEILAAKAYNNAARTQFGEFAVLNIIEKVQ